MAETPGIGELETAVVLDGGVPIGRVASDVALLERGRTVGRYVVLDRIGSGGMGVVYAAYDPELDRKLALKLLLPELGGGERASEGGGGRLLREAQAMAKLSHPNVVAVHDVTNEDGRICIAMELVDGGSLRQWLTATPRRWREVLAMFEGAARGLAAAHAQGIVHRDFKPDNVMVDQQGRARVMDFGLARFSDPLAVLRPADIEAHAGASTSKDLELTRGGAVMGTPAYMSPEQFLGEPTDGRSDQFGFCVALWEGLYGTRPHEAETFNDLMLKITRGELQLPTRSEVPSWVRNVLVRGLRPDPAERWPSMEALLDALHRDPTRWRRRAVVVGCAGVLVIGGLGLHAWSRQATEAQCERASREIERLWNDERAATIEQAFAATRIVHASTTFAKTRPWLDAWAQRWSEAHAATCRATLLEGERSPELHALSLECLSDRELALEVLLESLATPSDGMVSSAVESVVALPEIAPCTDDAWLRRQPARPEDPTEAARVVELRSALVRSEVLFADGDYGGAVELGRATLATIESLPGRPLEARARALLGLSLVNMGLDEEATRELEAGYLAGVRRRELEPATDAAMSMMKALQHLRRHEEALHWGRLADVTAELLGDDAFRLGERREARAHVLLEHGDYDDAIADFEEALRIRLETLGDRHPFVAAVRSSQSQAYLRAGRYADAEAAARSAVEALEEAIGPLHPNTARARLNLADVLLTRRELAAAETEIRASLEVLRVTVVQTDPVLATAHNNLGSVLVEQGKPEEALTELREALRLLRIVLGADHPNLGLIHGNIAALLDMLGRKAEAEVAIREAVQTFERTTGAEHPQATLLRINWAEQLVESGKLAEAEAVLREGLAATQQAVGADDPRTAWYANALGVFLAESGRAEEARVLLETAWTIREKADVEPLQRAETAWRLATVLADDPVRARTLALMARELFARLQQVEEVKAVDAWLARPQ